MTTKPAPKKQVSFRIAAPTFEHLRRRVRETGLSQTELAERYIEEGLRMDEHPLIVFREGAAGRRPSLAGSRLDVAKVIETVRQSASVEEAAEYFGIPVERVQACVRYYADHADEIDAWNAREAAITDREFARWLREQQLVR